MWLLSEQNTIYSLSSFFPSSRSLYVNICLYLHQHNLSYYTCIFVNLSKMCDMYRKVTFQFFLYYLFYCKHYLWYSFMNVLSNSVTFHSIVFVFYVGLYFQFFKHFVFKFSIKFLKWYYCDTFVSVSSIWEVYFMSYFITE